MIHSIMVLSRYKRLPIPLVLGGIPPYSFSMYQQITFLPSGLTVTAAPTVSLSSPSPYGSDEVSRWLNTYYLLRVIKTNDGLTSVCVSYHHSPHRMTTMLPEAINLSPAHNNLLETAVSMAAIIHILRSTQPAVASRIAFSSPMSPNYHERVGLHK